MVAALSWAARLKNGLARTREVLNTPVSELFVRRRVDESLFQDLESALLQADCGVAATDWLIASLRSMCQSRSCGATSNSCCSTPRVQSAAVC